MQETWLLIGFIAGFVIGNLLFFLVIYPRVRAQHERELRDLSKDWEKYIEDTRKVWWPE